jgi:acylphosphatase
MSDDGARRVRIVVSGRVQGVFFRATCAREARARGLAGWVRNRPDGAVEAVFEGPGRLVDEMVAWCRRGPELAHVDAARVSEETPTGERDFRVTR